MIDRQNDKIFLKILKFLSKFLTLYPENIIEEENTFSLILSIL